MTENNIDLNNVPSENQKAWNALKDKIRFAGFSDPLETVDDIQRGIQQYHRGVFVRFQAPQVGSAETKWKAMLRREADGGRPQRHMTGWGEGPKEAAGNILIDLIEEAKTIKLP